LSGLAAGVEVAGAGVDGAGPLAADVVEVSLLDEVVDSLDAETDPESPLLSLLADGLALP
jgi:hypothetical protein